MQKFLKSHFLQKWLYKNLRLKISNVSDFHLSKRSPRRKKIWGYRFALSSCSSSPLFSSSLLASVVNSGLLAKARMFLQQETQSLKLCNCELSLFIIHGACANKASWHGLTIVFYLKETWKLCEGL